MDRPVTAMGTGCRCHTHRELVPIEVHHVWPTGMGGPNIASNKVRICSNAHSSVHLFLDLLIKLEGKVPWPMARRYGPKVRELAWSGYMQWLGSQPR